MAPAEFQLDSSSARQQIIVTSVGPDGALQDVTQRASFQVLPDGVARVSASGVVSPRREGAGTVEVQYGGRKATASFSITGPEEPRPVSFRLDVAPVLSKAGCNMGACHGNLNGKGGFKLSLRGYDPVFDHASLTRDANARRVSLSAPERSLILLKPTGQVPHEGGVRFLPGSVEGTVLSTWVATGARDDLRTAPSLTGLEISPVERILAPGQLAQQLVVTAKFSDGTRRDVTRQASYDVSDPTRALVSADGRVEAGRPTETVVAVRYMDGRAVSRLAFLADRGGFVWKKPTVRNAVDELVFGKLEAIQVQPSEPATDPVFLRRAYLDAVGRLPTAEEARTFLSDVDPERRANLVDRLLRLPEFADHWALKWADLLRNEEKTMGEKGVWVFQRWLRDQIAAELPLDEFARKLVASSGSTWSNPPASFFRTNRDPMTAAETVGQVFLGVRLQCARCHNHPFDVWTQDDYYGLAAVFANVRQKDLSNARRDNLDKHEINGDEIVYLDGRPGIVQPRSGVNLPPKAPGGPIVQPPEGPDARIEFARWLTRGNDQFARNLANRVWFHLLGRGVVEPVDDFRDSNPPSNPALLGLLTEALVRNGYRLRPLVALIMKSEVYQLGAEPNESNADDEANFARATVRLLPAETLLDAVGQALGKPGGFINAPHTATATQLPGARMGGTFLKVFGKPDRLLTCECERSESTTLAQAFQLINGDAVRSKLESQDNRIGRLLASRASDDEVLDGLTLSSLSREPTASERSEFLAYVRSKGDRRKAWEDVAWTLVNSKEFLLRH